MQRMRRADEVNAGTARRHVDESTERPLRDRQAGKVRTRGGLHDTRACGIAIRLTKRRPMRLRTAAMAVCVVCVPLAASEGHGRRGPVILGSCGSERLACAAACAAAARLDIDLAGENEKPHLHIAGSGPGVPGLPRG